MEAGIQQAIDALVKTAGSIKGVGGGGSPAVLSEDEAEDKAEDKAVDKAEDEGDDSELFLVSGPAWGLRWRWCEGGGCLPVW